MTNVSKVIVAIIAIGLLCVLLNIISGKRSRRVRLFPMIFISFLLMILGTLFIVRHAELVERIVSITEYLDRSNLLLMNFFIMLFFIILKAVIKPVIVFVCRNNEVLESFSNTLYEYDEEYDEWFLDIRWTGFRQYSKWLVCGFCVTCGLYFGLTWLYGSSSVIWLPIFPCAALVVFNEVFCYINGQTKEEYEHSILGDEADSRRISNYYRLREIFEQILPDPLLTAHTGCEYIGRETPADMLESLKKSSDTIDQVTADYFEANDRYKTADKDCVQATLDLMHRKNVVFFNPFYRDLTMYITLPLVHALLSGKKCVVLCGRKNASEDVKEWLTDLLSEYSHMKALWRISFLSDQTSDFEVGILTFTQIYDKRILNVNRRFLREADFVLLVEPSLMLNTSQIALSIITEEMNKNEEVPVYCVCDRYTNGLVDTLSHLLRSEITDVVAMPVPRCNYTVISWNADGDFRRQQLFDKQTDYLGNGIELSAIAIKNQIPEVTWYSEKKAPIKDIKWISGQHFSTITRYMNLPSQQENMYEKIDFISTLWSAPKKREQLLIAEDEFCNMFSMMRAYLSRGENQIFVNILSENYLLRDYMRCNHQMFLTNPNAVPSYVPDYAKTERNTILKLMITMTLRPVSDTEIMKELHLVGIDTNDPYGEMIRLLKKYTYANESIFVSSSTRETINGITSRSVGLYTISEVEFDKYFSDSLKNAYYILEEEKDENAYIDAKLFTHVTQTVLPGQFITFDGKYYQAKHVSPQSGVVLRRASDQYDGRKYYRQVRTYHFDFGKSEEIVSNRKVMDIDFTEVRTDFSVDTTGYLEMNDSGNLRASRLVDFKEDPTVSDYTRKYRNKTVLKIHLPEADSKICFTICLLLSEIFRSVYPEGWPYLAAIIKQPEDIDGILNFVVYSSDGDVEDGHIYIVEDSDVDLGLIDSIEKNFMKLMEIIEDFLEWHFEKMREPASKDPVPVKAAVAQAEEIKQRNLVVRMLQRIRNIFGTKKENNVEVNSVEDVENKELTDVSTTADSDAELKNHPDTMQLDNSGETTPISGVVDQTNDSNESEYVLEGDFEESGKENNVDSQPDFSEHEENEADNTTEKISDEDNMKENVVSSKVDNNFEEDDFETKYTDNPDLIHIDGTDIFENDGMPDDNEYLEMCFQEMGLTPLVKTRYQKECYLKYGYEEIDGRIKIDDLHKYLRVRGWGNNALTLARKRDVLLREMFDTDTENKCDFCSLPLSGISYEKLSDGRIRCNDCSTSAVTTVEELKELYFRNMHVMEDFFEIHFHVPITIKMTDAKTIAKHVGSIFKPSTGYTPRILGYAQKRGSKLSILLENGSPRLATIDTIIHELTHIWQFLNWKEKDVSDVYGMRNQSCTDKAKDIVYEGMAIWASVQYLYQIGETYYAMQQETVAESRNDVYGIGFKIYKEQYPLIKDSALLKYSPFESFPPVEPAEVKNAIISSCREENCVC